MLGSGFVPETAGGARSPLKIARASVSVQSLRAPGHAARASPRSRPSGAELLEMARLACEGPAARRRSARPTDAVSALRRVIGGGGGTRPGRMTPAGGMGPRPDARMRGEQAAGDGHGRFGDGQTGARAAVGIRPPVGVPGLTSRRSRHTLRPSVPPRADAELVSPRADAVADAVALAADEPDTRRVVCPARAAGAGLYDVPRLIRGHVDEPGREELAGSRQLDSSAERSERRLRGPG